MIDFNKLQSAEVDKTHYPFFCLDNCLLDNPSRIALAKDFPDIKSGGSIPPSSINLKGSIKKLISDHKSYIDNFEKLINVSFKSFLSLCV